MTFIMQMEIEYMSAIEYRTAIPNNKMHITGIYQTAFVM